MGVARRQHVSLALELGALAVLKVTRVSSVLHSTQHYIKGGEVSGEWMLCWNHMRDTLTVEFVFNRRHERTTAMYLTEC